jgi:hypothetical protein
MTPIDPLGLPTELQVNAWTGDDDAVGALGPDSVRWALESHGEPLPKLLAPEATADPRDWRDPRVGWGLVLPDDDSLPDAVKARGEDAPAPLQALLAARPGSPVLRFRPRRRFTQLRRYYANRPAQDVGLSASARGVHDGALPRYLLLYGGPDVIPWEFQYIANQACAVGRLTLTGPGLERYIEALIGEWSGGAARVTHTVVWAVDHGPNDISSLMRRTIAVPLQRMLAADNELGSNALYFDGARGEATSDALCASLADQRPGLVVTTSHGKTGPLGDPVAMLQDLGLPVSGDFSAVAPADILDAWEPDGAVWYAHACCSAGNDAATIFRGLLEPGSRVDRILEGIAELGANVAPLPEALLGAAKPLRAFIGHVEPTFDWTIKNPETGQPLTSSICDALYNRLFQPDPVGFAMREPYSHVGELYVQRDAAYRAFDEGADTEAIAMATQLAARDRQSMVILGDPTVALPPLPSRAQGAVVHA